MNEIIGIAAASALGVARIHPHAEADDTDPACAIGVTIQPDTHRFNIIEAPSLSRNHVLHDGANTGVTHLPLLTSRAFLQHKAEKASQFSE
jgi:hypothetical protein